MLGVIDPTAPFSRERGPSRYFLKQGSALDEIAARRATTTYLIQQVHPMLPRVLCENLCSLNANVDRLAFSVVWTLDADANILSEWFGRTVIRSCGKLSYGHAQEVIEVSAAACGGPQSCKTGARGSTRPHQYLEFLGSSPFPHPTTPGCRARSTLGQRNSRTLAANTWRQT